MDANGSIDSNSSSPILEVNSSVDNEKFNPYPFLVATSETEESVEDLNLTSATNLGDSNNSLNSDFVDDNTTKGKGFLNKFKQLIP